MRILQVCKKPPWPARDGETIAITSITQGLIDAGQKVTVAAIATPKHPPAGPPPKEGTSPEVHSVLVDTRIKPGTALTNLIFSRNPYQVTRFLSHEFSQLLQQLLREMPFDIVQLEGLALAEYLPVIRYNTKAPVVMRAHNVENLIWKSVARHEKNLLRKWYLGNLARRLKRYELSHLNAYDGLVPITESDAQYFLSHGCTIPMLPLPTGLELSAYHHNGAAPRDHVFMLASWDWAPNQEGLRWFLDYVWPEVKRRLPDLRLVLAGRNAPQSLRKVQAPGVEFLGEVESSPEFLGRNGVMVVPLLSGSGLRIKIVEAMAAGVPTITTTIGAHGIDAVAGKHLLVADDPMTFAETIVHCIGNRQLQAELAKNAADFALNHYDIRSATKRLLAFYQGLTARTPQAPNHG